MRRFLLFDCDNFFVSCERAFNPSLKNRPVVVLSNNDGCVVARSNEAKAEGIAMCTPFFKIADKFKAMGGVALSSNYELYADMSNRVMALLRNAFDEIEIYSIDEAFAHSESENLFEKGLSVRNTILRQTGISVSVGIAPSKTLCKIAGETAKKLPSDKVLEIKSAADALPLLQKIDINDVWGVGRSITPKLNYLGIFTAAELAAMPRSLARSKFGINLEKTILELNGFPCLEGDSHSCQQSLICSRSFEHEIYQFSELKTILSEFTDKACQRLRAQQATASGIATMVETNRFKDARFYQNSCLISLPENSTNTARFIKAMNQGLERIFRAGLGYKRAGITLVGITPLSESQNSLFSNAQTSEKEQKLMTAFDEINKKLGSKTLYFGAQAAGINHYIRRARKSCAYTTNWNDLLKIS